MEPPKPVRTSIFFYVPLAIAGLLLVVYVFVHNYRKGEEAGLVAPPPAEGTRTAVPQVNERALAKDTGLAAKGRTLFQINCASCHGPDGHGNGDRAASLNPKPRNFHEEKFKFGNDIVSIHNTILKGSPGTSMPSFALLSPEETWAMAHFVETQVPDAPPITDEIVAQVSEGSSGSGARQPGATAGVSDTSKKGGEQRIPIKFAMERLERESPAPKPASKTMKGGHPGRTIFMNRCASCHGEYGEGKPTAVASIAPYRYITTGSFQNRDDAWMSNRNEFGRMVVKGLPGRMMPGNATLTKQEVDDLYDYVRGLPRVKPAQRPIP
jgi:mono/diheme cytochrome c family protein